MVAVGANNASILSSKALKENTSSFADQADSSIREDFRQFSKKDNKLSDQRAMMPPFLL
jgi:hypothetical protein